MKDLRFTLPVTLLLALVAMLKPASADIIIDLQSPVITAAGLTTVDVLIRSDTLGGDDIAFYEMEFEIVPFAGNQPGTSCVSSIRSIPLTQPMAI